MKTYVINLSSIITTEIKRSFEAFEDLLEEYSTWCLPCCSFFTAPVNNAWLKLTFYRNKKLIDDYKKGAITTDEFLEQLLIIFDFYEGFIPYPEDEKNVKEERNNFYRTKHLGDNWIDPEDIAAALIEKAWRAMLVWDEESKNKLLTILEQAKKEGARVVFMSNTNPLHVEHFLRQARADLMNEIEIFPEDEIKGLHGPIVHEEDYQEKCIAIARNIFIAPSYRFGLLKTADSVSGESILNELCKLYMEDEIVVLSQYPEDLAEGERLGLRCQQTDVFLEECRGEVEERFFSL